MSIDELIKKANYGDVTAMEELGRQFSMNGDYSKSIAWNRKAAEMGSGSAMLALSSIYRNGFGVQVNISESNMWLKKSADAGYGAAMFSIIGRYRDGSDGFEQNPSLAFMYVQRICAVEGWSTFGRFETAESYLKGIGTSKDVNRAYNMFLALANEGYADAQFKLAYLFASGKEFDSNHEQAMYWANQALNSTKTAGLAKIEKVHQLTNQLIQMENENQVENNNESSGGCYVATAVYGSYDCPQVWVLRRYRDYHLAETWHGRAFIHIYYAISPTLVKWFRKTKWFNKLFKVRLDRMVSNLMKDGYDDSPYKDKF